MQFRETSPVAQVHATQAPARARCENTGQTHGARAYQMQENSRSGSCTKTMAHRDWLHTGTSVRNQIPHHFCIVVHPASEACWACPANHAPIPSVCRQFSGPAQVHPKAKRMGQAIRSAPSVLHMYSCTDSPTGNTCMCCIEIWSCQPLHNGCFIGL